MLSRVAAGSIKNIVHGSEVLEPIAAGVGKVEGTGVLLSEIEGQAKNIGTVESQLGKVVEKEAAELINQSSLAILKDGYYEVNGFKFSEYYYNRLWDNGRGAPSLTAKAVLENATNITPDLKKSGFFKYVADGWEMVYNPVTKEVWHLQPINR